MTDHNSAHDAERTSTDNDSHVVSIAFECGGRIVYERSNAQAWVQADEDAVVEVER